MDEAAFHRAAYRPGTLVDVGAHDGMLTLPFAALPGSQVVAFEPLPPAFARLEAAVRAAYGGRIPPHVRLQREALGAAAGELTLAVPYVGEDAIEQWASVSKDFAALQRDDPRVGRVDRYRVPVATLDSFALTGVTAIKLDAEGAEEEVLRGAEATLRRWHPVLTVELEERHRAGCTVAVPEWLAGLGYDGFFHLDGAWHGIDRFDAASMQQAAASPAESQMSDPYVFAFAFVAKQSNFHLPDLR